MSKLRVLYHLARADFLERARRYSFLLMLGATTYLGYAINRGQFYLRLDDYRGLLNSAWVGGMMASCAIMLLSLFGFYMVKNAIARDTQTGVGQIIATSPVSQMLYLLGKWLSNWAVLAALIAILAFAAVVMQFLGGESAHLDLITLILPFILLALPALAMVAALALLFETIPWLRGGFGNVLYFFLWTFALAGPIILNNLWLDWSGIAIIYQSMGAAVRAVHPTYEGTFSFTWQALPEGGLHTFVWSGVEWTTPILLNRVVWMAGSLGLTLLGSAFFHRFDPSREKSGLSMRFRKPNKLEDVTKPDEQASPLSLHLDHLTTGALRFDFLRLILAESRLMLKGQRWWWYVGALVFIIGGLVSPVDVARRGWLLGAWFWPILIWSGLGTSEGRYRTDQIVFSSPHPLMRQLPATWLAGLIVTVLCGSGVGLNLVFHGHWAALGAWLAGAIFIPSLALTLGLWSGTNKLFEITYLLLWYLGPLHPIDMPNLDFMGATDAAIIAGTPAFIALSSIALLGLAVLGRLRQLRR